MKTSLYYSIYTDIKQKIEKGDFPLGTKLPTDKDLAISYGVSIITIKSAMDLLRNDGYIIRKPRSGTEVVKSVNEKKNYSEEKPLLFGVVIPNFNDVFGSKILRSILSFEKENINFIVKMSFGNPKREEELIRQLLEVKITGLIIMPTSTENASHQLIKLVGRNFPMVVIDRLMFNLPVCSVRTDGFTASKALTNHFFEMGHKKIGLVSSSTYVSTVDERINGFITAHLEKGISVSQSQILYNIDSLRPNSKKDVKEDIEEIKNFICSNNDLTGLVTTEYNVSSLVYQALKELHRTIPTDISLATFDNNPSDFLNLDKIQITHIEQKQSLMGTKAVELLLKKINNKNFLAKETLDFDLIYGNTVKNLQI